MNVDSVVMLLPAELVAFRLTVYVAFAQYVCTGFFIVEFVQLPSPKVQFQLVGLLVEVSVKVTVRGAVPVRCAAVKEATGFEI